MILTNHTSRSLGIVRRGILTILEGKEPRLPKLSAARLLGARLRDGGIAGLKKEYRRIGSSGGEDVDFSERQLRELGSYLRGRKKTGEAVAVLELNVEAYPKSVRAREDLSDALLSAGRREDAVKVLEGALALEPGSDRIKNKLKKSRKP